MEPNNNTKNNSYHGDINDNISKSTGIEGRTIYVLLIILLFLMMLCIFNLIVLAVGYQTLHINTSGMESLAFRDNGRLQWLQDSNLEYVLIQNGIIGGFNTEDLTFSGNTNNNVSFRGGKPESRSSLIVGQHGAVFQTNTEFDFIDPHTQKNIFHLGRDLNVKLNGNIKINTLNSNTIHVAKILCNENDLSLSADSINVTGNEGLFLDSKVIQLNADGDISLNVQDTKSALKISGHTGLYLDSIISTTVNTVPNQQSNGIRYKLCGCSNNGRLFRLKLTDDNAVKSCALATINPCL